MTCLMILCHVWKKLQQSLEEFAAIPDMYFPSNKIAYN